MYLFYLLYLFFTAEIVKVFLKRHECLIIHWTKVISLKEEDEENEEEEEEEEEEKDQEMVIQLIRLHT